MINNLGEINRGRLEYKEAIDRGGEVEFRVSHDHGRSKVTMKGNSCEGHVWISKKLFRYLSNDKQHKFNITDDQILEVNAGAMMGLSGGFYIKVRSGTKKPEIVHFHSSREKQHKEEEKLIVDLIKR